MKQKFLLLAVTLFACASMYAQRTAPQPSSTAEIATDGETTQYLYNVGAGGFFAGGNDWGTRASVAGEGDQIRMKQLADGKYNLGCYPASKNAWLYVSCNNWDALWVDAANETESDQYPGTDTWQVSDDGTYYYFQNLAYDNCNMGVAEIFKGEKGNTRVYMKDANQTYEYNEETLPAFEGNFYDQWVFVSEEVYKAMKDEVAIYQAATSLSAAIYNANFKYPSINLAGPQAVYDNEASTLEELQTAATLVSAYIKLKDALDKAKETYPNLDYSQPEATLANTQATLEELETATGNVQGIINNYLAQSASFDDPLDMTDIIGDGSSVDSWTRAFTGTGEVGTWHTNTWSTEADNNGDGTDMTTPFCEDWVGSGNILSDQKIYQVLKSAAPGLYKFTADVRLYNEAGAYDELVGCTMYFGEKSIDISSKVSSYKSGNKTVLWSKDYFSVIAIVTESGDIEFGFDIKDATFNWLAFKNTSLTYYGNENVVENAAILLKEAHTFELVDEDEIAYPAYVTAYNQAVEAYNAAMTEEAIEAAAKEALDAKQVLDESITAYAKLLAKIDEWNNNMDASYSGSYWDAYCEFVQADEEEEIEGYPTPVPNAILSGTYPFSTTEEINTYIQTVDELYTQAVANSLKEGDDCTNMLINPAFGSGTGTYSTTGWTGSAALGGLSDYMCAERFSTTVNFYQTVKNAPAGIYRIETHAFVRPAANGSYNGSETINCWLYMNKFRTRVQNIVADALPMEEAIDQENCYLSTTTESYWPSSTWTTGYDYEYNGDSYVPNCMVGAAYAFRAGRYAVTTYGLVADGEDMQIGITSDGANVHWFLFSGFKLVYEGKNETAVKEVIDSYLVRINELKASDDYIYIGKPAQETLDAAIATANSTTGEEKYNALIALVDALADAEASIAAYKALEPKIGELETAMETYALTATSASVDEAIALYDEVDGVLTAKSATTAEAEAYIEKIDEAIAELKIPMLNPDASLDNPQEMDVIVNATFDEIGVFTGWSSGFGAGGEKAQSAECYDKNFDVWQDVTVPEGYYRLSANGSYRTGSATQDYEDWQTYKDAAFDPTLLTFLYAVGENGDTAAVQVKHCSEAGQPDNSTFKEVAKEGEWYVPNTMAEFDQAFHDFEDIDMNVSLIVKVGEDRKLRIGVINQDKNRRSTSWALFDDFKIQYVGQTGEPTGNATAIQNVENADAFAPQGIFNLAGQRVNTMTRGLYIVNGKKVLVK